MKFSYTEIWDDAARMMRANAPLLVAIAGVFLFLPALLAGYLLPPPDERSYGAIVDYYRANWGWLLLANVVNMVGAIAILLLLFDRKGATVGNALVASLTILPAYFAASLLSGLAVGLAGLLLLIPGLYLFGRLAPVGPIVVAEERNPFRALSRSFALTKGHGWAVLGLVLLVAVAGLIVSFAVSAVFGSVALLLAGDRLGGLLVAILGALTSAALSTVLVVLFAAIYRRLSGSASSNGI